MNPASFVTIVEICAMVLLVAVSAFCSSAEMSLFSLSRPKVLSYKDDPSPVRRRIWQLMSGQHKTLITIIFCNMFVNSCVSMLNDEVMENLKLSPTLTLIVSGVTGIIILLLFGEISPMTVAYVYAEKWSAYVATPVYIARKVLSPLTTIVEKLCNKCLNLMGRASPVGLSQEEYLSFIDLSYERGTFTKEEAKLMKETFALRSKSVESVMRTRSDLHFVSRNASPAEISRTIREYSQAYLPVTADGRLDTADAILSARSFFALAQEERLHWQTSSCVDSKALYIPEKTTLEKALRTMKGANANAALAADEYGAVSGVITREDIYSELTGRSVELDAQPVLDLVKIGENRWIFDGLTTFDFLCMALSLKVEPGRFSATTLNGVFCELLGAIPQQGDSVSFDNVTMFASVVSRNRVTRVLVTLESPSVFDGEAKKEAVQ